MGTGSKPNNLEGRLIYFMKVTATTTFTEYWLSPEFRAKRPVMNGSRMQQYGDNIYHRAPETMDWHQANSFHSAADGSLSLPNLARDTETTDRVLISTDFAYWGKDGPLVPDELSEFVHKTQGHRCRYQAERVNAIFVWLAGLPRPPVLGRPVNWPAAAG